MPTPTRRERPSAPLVLSTIALFVSLGGAGYAATGDPFVLGEPNSATGPTSLTASSPGGALRVTNPNTADGTTALQLTPAADRPPLRTSSETKVPHFNADLLDGLSSAELLRKGFPESMNESFAGGVVDVTNTGTSNGVQGKTQGPTASGVYGEHVGVGGFGVAGRAGNGGNAVYGDNIGTGYAGFFEDKVRVGGNLELGGSLDCTGCVGASDVSSIDGSDVSGKVNDSDNLDGLDSTAFLRGNGGADGQAIAEGLGANNFLGPAFGGLVRLQYQCPASIGSNGSLRIINSSTSVANFFIDSGGANPDYIQLGSGGFITYPAAAGGESFLIQAQGAGGVAVINVGTVHRPATIDCHAQALGLIAG